MKLFIKDDNRPYLVEKIHKKNNNEHRKKYDKHWIAGSWTVTST